MTGRVWVGMYREITDRTRRTCVDNNPFHEEMLCVRVAVCVWLCACGCVRVAVPLIQCRARHGEEHSWLNQPIETAVT